MKTSRTLRTFVGTCALALAIAPAVIAQDTQSNTRSATVVSGQKMKLKGAIVRRDADSFVVQDDVSGAQTTVVLNDRTSVKTRGGLLGGGTKYALTAVSRGLHVEIEGRGDSSGNLIADKVRFTDADLRAARTLEANIVPVEGRVGTAEARVGEVEQNAQRMSGQLDELAAVSNAAAGGAVAAQETAERAVNGVQVANERINSIDDYTPEQSIKVNFKLRSAVLTPEAKTSLDQVAEYAKNAKGFLIEVTGYAYESKDTNVNRRLSEQRAESVVRYLVENHNIPIRRILTPFGYGAKNALNENKTRDERAENRRAEVRVLVNRGLTGTPGDGTKISAATQPE
ncbi:MAG: OmpA-OmpF porin, family [Acidobacteriota bacterium]|jgi:outer membrane protein OmpA-like peptidoglycan-associated protein|nr:OmpA-OmpF porin, family [Acidobacteriota bacterium]